MFRCWRRIFLLIGLASTNLLAISDVGWATVPEPGDLRAAGKVDFPISCTPAVQSEFARGVALLHSFFYEEARRIFTSVAEQDPKCAMAQWGIAMTWWHPIWTPPTRRNGRGQGSHREGDGNERRHRSRAGIH